MLEVCPSPGSYQNDPRFQKLMESYKDKHYPAHFVMMSIIDCREYYDYDEDWIPDTPAEKAVLTKYIKYHMLNHKLSRTDSKMDQEHYEAMYDTLYTNFTPQQLNNRLDMLATLFRNLVSAKERKETAERSRQDIIRAMANDKGNAYVNMMHEVFDYIAKHHANGPWVFEQLTKNMDIVDENDPRIAEYSRKAWDIVDKAEQVLQFKEQLAALAAPRIGEMEGFAVSVKDMNVSFDEQADEESETLSEEGESATDGHDTEEGMKGERYTDFRVLKLMETLSPRCRRFLSTIRRTDANGHYTVDDMQMPQYVGGRQAVIVLRRALVNSTPETFMSDLEAAAERNTWVNELIRRLKAEPDMQALIYCDMKKAESTYVYDNFVDGKLLPRIANSRSAGFVLMREAGNNMTGGWVLDEKYSLYEPDGTIVSREKLRDIGKEFDAVVTPDIKEELRFINLVKGGDRFSQRYVWQQTVNAYGPDSTAVKYGAEPRYLDYLLLEPVEAMKEFLRKHPELPEKLALFARGAGFDITADDIRVSAVQEMTQKSWELLMGFEHRHDKKDKNKLIQIINGISGMIGAAEASYGYYAVPTGQYVYNTATWAMKLLNSCVALSKYNEVENRVLNEGKTLSTYNNVNLLHQVVDDLSNKKGLEEDEYNKMMEEKYLQFEGMSLGYGDKRKATGWLKWLIQPNRNPALDHWRSKVKVIDCIGYNHVEYSKMTTSQKLLNAMAMYFESQQFNNMPAFEVPIQSDYTTAYNFITMATVDYDAYEKALLNERNRLTKEAGDDEEKVKEITDSYNQMLKDSNSTLHLDFVYTLNGHHYASELVNELADEVLIELERIDAIEKRVAARGELLTVYERQGRKFQIFPEFNDNGFRKKYSEFTDAQEARDFVCDQIAEQLRKVLDADIAKIEQEKVLQHPAMKQIKDPNGSGENMYAENGTFAELPVGSQQMLIGFCLNTFYARQQMIKIFTGGMEQFNGLLDYEKRNMLLHATHSSLYPNATWKGKMPGWKNPKTGQFEPFGSKQNVVYLEDDKAVSAVLDDIKEMLGQLKAEKVISAAQYSQMIDAYSNIKVTDGQGFRTLDSYRAIMIQTAQWTDELERAYIRIKKGNPQPQDINKFMHGIKPVYTGYETVAPFKDQKPVRLTVLHKYSECVLLPVELAKYCLKVKSAPLMAFDKVQKRLAKDGKRVDMFLMHSGGKVGAFSIVNPFAKDKATGERKYKTADEIADCIYNSVTSSPTAIHEFDMNGYGIAASVSHETADEKISMASQAEKVGMANISEGDTVTIRGKQMNARDARELYYQTKAADTIEMYQRLRETFVNSDELDKMFREEIAQKAYSPMEMQFALQHLANGQWAMPLFAPNIEHQVQELLASVIKKRLTKPKNKGANILQATGLGMDMDASPFEGNDTLSEEDKLRVVFEGTGAAKRIKYVEVFMPIHDRRLAMFAERNGGISPARLRELVADGTIPESMLEFIAYRTPSDAEHSVIPCRVKGFTANIEGATLEMPKEIMVMTGHDYDGDKMRCHFKNFRVVDKNDDDINLSDADYLRMVLGQMDVENSRFMKCVVDEYDYGKSPLENSPAARNNARVEIFFSQLTSPEGSRRVLIPGGCDETKIIAKSMFLTRAASDDRVKDIIAGVLQSQGMSEHESRLAVKNSSSLYDTLVRRDDWQLSDIMTAVNGYETPYSLKHSVDSFEYIMGGAEMIGIYAMYNSAFQMFQRLNLNYNTITSNGTEYTVSLLGHKYGHLFDIKNHRGRLASLGLARLLNAAVDNGKDPVLGYLHQSPEMAKLTFFMLAAGSTEEEVHLVMNQPAVIELINRLKSKDSLGMHTEVQDLLQEVAGTGLDSNSKTPMTDTRYYFKPLDIVAKMTRDDFTGNLGKTFGEILIGNDEDAIRQQAAVLQFLNHINSAANDIADFVRFTRPESSSGAIGTTVASIVSKEISLNEFRAKIEDKNYTTITGMRDVLAKRDVDAGWEPSYLNGVIGNKLPEVVALNTLMIDSARDMFLPFFPQARQSWVDVATKVAKLYDYRTVSEDLLKKIMNDMILWKLLSDRQFTTGDPQVEQKRVIVDVPKDLHDLKARIETAHKNPGTDPAAEALYGNVFLNKFRLVSPEEEKNPRLMFIMDGAPAEGSRDMITSSWGQMLRLKDEKINKLAVDLFKYNIYTNGFAYGMYEFAHFAPMNVLQRTFEYVPALRRMLKSNWRNDADTVNFINQYIMNHWGEERLVQKVQSSSLKILGKTVEGGEERLMLSPANDKSVLEAIGNQMYLVVSRPGNKSTGGRGSKSVQTLYRVEAGTAEAPIILTKAAKLGGMTRRRQVTRQYNPTVDYHFVQAVTPGNDSAWGVLNDLELREARALPASEADIERITSSDEAAKIAEYKAGFKLDPLALFGPAMKPKAQRQAQEKAAKVTRSDSQIERLAKLSGNVEQKQTETTEASENDGRFDLMPEERDESTVPVGLGDFFGFGAGVDSEALKAAVVRSSETDAETSESGEKLSEDDTEKYKNNGQMLNIVRRDEKGEFVTEEVPATPDNVRLARRQRTFVELNEKLEHILNKHGVGVGALYSAEARVHFGGIADFETADVTAAGLVELIRIAEGYEGEQALPEEFAHVALEMLGHNHPLVKRLLSAIDSSDEALQEAYNGMYNEYVKMYGEDNKAKLVLEAAGKLVAKHLFLEQEIQTNVIKRLVSRVCDAIKDFFRKFSRDEVQNAIFDANRIASKIAREMLGGRLADEMNLENIATRDKLFSKIQKDLTGKQDVLSKLLKTETKRLAILKKRLGYANKGASQASLQAAEAQVTKLKSAIDNHKTEEAVLSYLNDSLDFLAKTEKSLDDAVNSGRPMNSVCRKLNTVRDTIYSYARAIDDVRTALNDGELTDTTGLVDTLEQVSLVVSRFNDKYTKLARTYFEEMLSSVYGEHGKTVEIGKHRGQVISIHDMARKADHDISFASRWFYAIADCNDYVLKAVDDVVRGAKVRARRKALEVRPRIEAAIADLQRATGSRDQSFMFERDKDGKRTGLYLKPEVAKKQLTPAQFKFYSEMMAIKADADKCIPSSLYREDHLNMVMLRKYTLDKIKDANGLGSKALEAWEGIKNMVMDTSDNFDPENHEVAVDFQGNRVDMLPVKFVLKGKNESFDDMTEDVATSMMTYAGMAYEYNELNGVVAMLENAKYMAAERDVIQKTGNRTQRESIETDDAAFREPFTKKAARLHAQAALEDFFYMHVYGHRAANEGTFGNTRISKRKVVDTINNVVSLSQMALNIPQRISNVNTGLMQVVIESAGRGVYNTKDAAWASAVYMKESGDRLVQTGKTDYDNKLSLWMEYFDIHQDNGRNGVRYSKGRMSRIFNGSLLYAGLAMGEDYLSAVTSLAAARNFKVKDSSGKIRNLWDAYEVKYRDAANKTGAYLELKNGYTKVDGTPITAADEAAFSKKVVGLNFELQGIYNLDDRSAVQQYAFGALIIMYRKWIAPAIKRRYGATQFNMLKDSYEEGYYRTWLRNIWDSLVDAKDAVTEEDGAKALLNIFADVRALVSAYKINYNKLTAYEKSNITRAWTELGIVLGLFLSTALLLRFPPDDHDNETLQWLDNLALSQLLRLRAELGAMAPTPLLVGEALRILKSPFAAIGPIKSTLNIFQLMLPHNWFTEIKTGKYKGHVKAYKYFREFPIISMFKKIDNFVDPSPLIQYYRNESTFGW